MTVTLLGHNVSFPFSSLTKTSGPHCTTVAHYVWLTHWHVMTAIFKLLFSTCGASGAETYERIEKYKSSLQPRKVWWQMSSHSIDFSLDVACVLYVKCDYLNLSFNIDNILYSILISTLDWNIGKLHDRLILYKNLHFPLGLFLH